MSLAINGCKQVLVRYMAGRPFFIILVRILAMYVPEQYLFAAINFTDNIDNLNFTIDKDKRICQKIDLPYKKLRYNLEIFR